MLYLIIFNYLTVCYECIMAIGPSKDSSKNEYTKKLQLWFLKYYQSSPLSRYVSKSLPFRTLLVILPKICFKPCQ